MIVGIDEVGRGAWAGPLCVAAVGLGGVTVSGITDSKKISKQNREKYSLQIKQAAPYIGIGWVSAATIDTIGMSEALKLAARRSISSIDIRLVTQIIIDGTIRLIDDPRVVTMKQADLLVPSVSAASIIAKVARDAYMERVGRVFPDYHFASHVGYGTLKHQQALSTYGPTALHRASFAPIKALPKVKTVSEGTTAELYAAQYLIAQGFTIIEQNWQTKWCEIDIIARKNDITHFVEVKYRRADSWGTGLEAITPKKLRQMKFAAELWLSSHRYREARLSSISLGGASFEVKDYVDIMM